MTKISLLFLFIFCGGLRIVYCENDSTQENEIGNSNFGGRENFLFNSDAESSEDRSIEKRRLLFPESDIDDGVHQAKISMNRDLTKKIFNHTKNNDHYKLGPGTSGLGNNHWENEKHSYSTLDRKDHVGSAMDFHSRFLPTNPNHMYNWGKSNTHGNGHSEWNEEKNFQQFLKSNSDHKYGSQYNGKVFNENINTYSGFKDSNTFDKRVEMTLTDTGMRHMNKYNDYRDDRLLSGYQAHSGNGYNMQKDSGFWDAKYFKPEKGVIINVNTDCQRPRQFGNQMVHRVVISPKSPLNTHAEVSSYQFPGPSFISAPQLAPPYYF